MRRVSVLAAGLLLLGMTVDARADIIFSLNQGSLQPDENVLFNCDTGCVNGPALTVVGATNNTGNLISFTGEENLTTPAIGQARVTAADTDGYSTVLIDTVDPTLFFSEFETNVRIFAQTFGTATIFACNQFAACETFQFALGSGENFFVLSVVSPQLIDTVRISSEPVNIMDVRQTRVSLATSEGEEVTVAEPASLALVGLGVMVAAGRFRKKRTVI